MFKEMYLGGDMYTSCYNITHVNTYYIYIVIQVLVYF